MQALELCSSYTLSLILLSDTAVGGLYCRFFALKHGNAIFYERGISGRPVEWKNDPQLLQRWKAGTLGMPLVDANMRELAATGAPIIVKHYGMIPAFKGSGVLQP